MSKLKILLGVSGSIAAYKTAALASTLIKENFEVQVVPTDNALKFVGEATFEGLTGRRVFKNTFAEGQMMSHIDLARWADLFVIAPATAATLNRLAYGIAEDALTTLFLAFERHKPILVAPAMNSVMYAHPTVQEALVRLKSYDVHVLEPDSGLLACGESGPGRMVEPDRIFAKIRDLITVRPQEKNTSQKKILVTSGGTREPVDGVRSITNFSTGQTGASLADQFAEEGYDVTLLCAKGSAIPKSGVRKVEFETFDELSDQLQKLLAANDYYAVLHLAAVSDFSVDKISTDDGVMLAPDRDLKLDSDRGITLHLKQNPKLVTQLKAWSKNPNIKVIAYKLTHTNDSRQRQEAISELLERPQVDWVVHNDLSEITSDQHVFRLYDKDGASEAGRTKKEMADAIMRFSFKNPEVQP